jgi:anti-anti-sigma factor
VTLLAHISEEHDDLVALAGIHGEIDASNAGEIGARLRTLLTNPSVALIVDLTATTYLDSAGINLLFALDAELRDRQQQLHLVVARSSPIARMVAISGLAAAVPTHATREEARAALASSAP